MASSRLNASMPRPWRDAHPQLWLRVLVCAGVLLASVYVGRTGSRLLLPVVPGILVVLVFLRWPPLGLVALVVASLVVPFSIGTGTQTSLNASLLLLPLLLGLWLVGMVRQRELRLLPSAAIPPLLALCGAAIIAFLAGNQLWLVFARTAPLAAQAGGLAIFLFSAGAFLLVAHQVRELRWLERLTWVFLAVAAFVVLGRFVPGLGHLLNRLAQNGSQGSLFWTWLAAMTFSQAAFNRQLALPARLALFGLLLATIYQGFFLTRDWTSGWLPPFVAITATLWIGAPRFGLVATLLGGAAMAVKLQRVIATVMGGDNTYSLSTRLEAWRILAEIVKLDPVFGIGPANYYWYTPLYPIQGYAVSFNSHNNYVDIVAQTGLVGLACFLWFAWALGRVGWRLRRRASEGFARAYVYGVVGGLVGTLAAAMLGDWVLPFVYNIGFNGFRSSVLGWLFLGGLVAVEHITAAQETRRSRTGAAG